MSTCAEHPPGGDDTWPEGIYNPIELGFMEGD